MRPQRRKVKIPDLDVVKRLIASQVRVVLEAIDSDIHEEANDRANRAEFESNFIRIQLGTSCNTYLYLEDDENV